MSSFTQKKHARKEVHLKLLINGGKKSKMHGIKSTHDPFLSLPVYKQAPSVARWPTILWTNLLYSNINSNESDLYSQEIDFRMNVVDFNFIFWG